MIEIISLLSTKYPNIKQNNDNSIIFYTRNCFEDGSAVSIKINKKQNGKYYIDDNYCTFDKVKFDFFVNDEQNQNFIKRFKDKIDKDVNDFFLARDGLIYSRDINENWLSFFIDNICKICEEVYRKRYIKEKAKDKELIKERTFDYLQNIAKKYKNYRYSAERR